MCRTTDIFGDPKKFQKEGSFAYIDEGADLSLLRNNRLVFINEFGEKTETQWESEIDFNWEDAARNGALVWILKGKIPKGTKRSFKLVLENEKSKSSGFKVEHINDKYILVKKGETPVIHYNYGIVNQSNGKDGGFNRSCYIHPLWTPTGKIITGDFTEKNMHKAGLFFTWGKAKFGNIEADFWEQKKETERMVADNFGPSIIDGPIFTELALFNKGVIKDKTYFREINTIKVYNQVDKNYYIFDMYFKDAPINPDKPEEIPVEVTGATRKPWEKAGEIIKPPRETIPSTELLQCQYGGITFNGTNEWTSKDIILNVMTSERNGPLSGNVTHTRWIDYTGPLGDEQGGLAVFDHPKNKRYPTPLHTYPEGFCYTFTNDSSYTLYMDEPLELIYRIVVHTGTPDREFNERIANDFTEPPNIKWEALR